MGIFSMHRGDETDQIGCIPCDTMGLGAAAGLGRGLRIPFNMTMGLAGARLTTLWLPSWSEHTQNMITTRLPSKYAGMK